jgi:hypothetical protein
MPDVYSFDQENHIFGDIGSVVADALKVPGYKNQIDSGWDNAGVALHGRQQFRINGVA